MASNDNAVGAETREVRTLENRGEPLRAVESSRSYPTDIDDLWDALTSAERLPRWFLPVTGDFEAGGRYQLEGNAGGTIERCDPPRALHLTWEFGDNVSWVRVRLEPEGENTRLTLVHTMPCDEASEAHWAKYGPGATGVGWDLGLWGLGLYVESGDVDQEATEKWMTTAAGKDFIRGCAAAWGEAHVTAGENADRARAMADETASFYTGV